MARKHKMVLQHRSCLPMNMNMFSCYATVAFCLDMDIGLINAKPPSRTLLDWLDVWVPGPHMVPAEARFSKYECCHKGNIVAIKSGVNEPPWWCGRVLFHGFSSVMWLILQLCHSTGAMPFRMTCRNMEHMGIDDQEPVLVFLEDLQEVLTYSRTGNMIVVLQPISLYGQ